MAAAEGSPFDSCKFDDAPLPPLTEAVDPTADACKQEGVASMIDSPFASSLITPGLMEQLSHSFAAGKQPADEALSGDQHVPQHTQQAVQHAGQHAARAGSGAATSAADATAAGKDSEQPRLQGVASILESPFASSCVSHEAQQQLQQLNITGADKAAA